MTQLQAPSTGLSGNVELIAELRREADENGAISAALKATINDAANAIEETDAQLNAILNAIGPILSEPGQDWTPVCSFFVGAKPAPGGSKKYIPERNGAKLKTFWSKGKEYPVGYIVDDAKGNAAWMKKVADAARRSYRGPLLDEPLAMRFVFFVRRPKSHYRSGKFSHLLKPKSPKYHITRPDNTKLTRSTEDAMKDVVYVDDCRFIWGPLPIKAYGKTEGVQIHIWKLKESEDSGQ